MQLEAVIEVKNRHGYLTLAASDKMVFLCVVFRNIAHWLRLQREGRRLIGLTNTPFMSINGMS